MQTAVRHADSVHVAGTLSSGGVPIGIDLSLRRGGDVTGTVRPAGAPYQVIAVAGTVYVKATRQFLQQIGRSASACATACGKWLRLAPADARQLGTDLSMATMTATLLAAKLPGLAEAGTTTVSGSSAWVVRTAELSQLDIGTDGRHYPVAASTANPRSRVTYSNWNAVPPPVPPPASQVVDAAGLP